MMEQRVDDHRGIGETGHHAAKGEAGHNQKRASRCGNRIDEDQAKTDGLDQVRAEEAGRGPMVGRDENRNRTGDQEDKSRQRDPRLPDRPSTVAD